MVHCMKFTKRLIGLLILSVSIIGCSAGLSGKIICFGDSITYGALVEGHSWADQLALKSDNIVVVNAGRKGRKTSDRDELPPIVEANTDADYFLIFLGVNDLKDGTDSMVTASIDNMKWMTGYVKENIPGVKIVLIAPCGINLDDMSELNQSKKYNENTAESIIKLEKGYKDLSTQQGYQFISLLNTVSPENFVDGIHPTVEGQTEIVDKIWKELSTD